MAMAAGGAAVRATWPVNSPRRPDGTLGEIVYCTPTVRRPWTEGGH